MAEIQQWRRKIQPTKTRTTVPFLVPTLDVEELDELQPPTPRRRLKPKLSAYFNQASKAATLTEDHSRSNWPKWPFDQTYPDPKPEDEMDAVMCHLMAQPYCPLGVHFNASLMRIFESYLALKTESVNLKARCDGEIATAQAVIAKSRMAEEDWEDERRDYKEEVKRLEVLLSRSSRRGLAEVTLARQESKLRARHSGGAQKKETIFEFLEKTAITRENDKTWGNQRATMKPLLQSSSSQDINLSQQLSQKKSMTNIHADLPFGTPPVKDMRFSLTNLSMLDRKMSNTTDDTFSAFSCAGDVLPDDGSTHAHYVSDIGEAEDLTDVENIANALARRRGVAPSHVMPHIKDLFGEYPHGGANRTCSAPNALGISTGQLSSSTKVNSSTGIVKRATVMTRASGFFHKLKPQSAVDPAATALAPFRRFSFEPGDDVVAQHIATPGFVVSPGSHTMLRKSASLCSMSSRTPSRIPTPVYTPGTVVRPRRERDESSSSLLTAIKQSDDDNSRASSVYSSPSVYREEFIKTSPSKDQGSTSGLSLRRGNRLLDHTNDLRGGGSRDGGNKRSHACGIVEGCEGHESLSDMTFAQEENFDPLR